MAFATSVVSKSESPRWGPDAPKASVVWTDSGRGTIKMARGAVTDGADAGATGGDDGECQAPNLPRMRESIWSRLKSPTTRRAAWSGRKRRANSPRNSADVAAASESLVGEKTAYGPLPNNTLAMARLAWKEGSVSSCSSWSVRLRLARVTSLSGKAASSARSARTARHSVVFEERTLVEMWIASRI